MITLTIHYKKLFSVPLEYGLRIADHDLLNYLLMKSNYSITPIIQLPTAAQIAAMELLVQNPSHKNTANLMWKCYIMLLFS